MSTLSDRPTEDGMSIFSTLEAFKDGLTGTLSRSGAADVCHGWAAKIEDANRPDLAGIRDALTTLARQLEGDQAEGSASAADIGATMKTLGAHTAEVADTIEEDHLKAPLRRLGGYVKAAGMALEGGSRPDEIAGVSTDTDGTPGDPELRTVNTAPDVSGEALDADRAGVKDRSGDIGEIAETPGDRTPGTKLDPA
ncbi:hypothetical protein [Rubrivirga sp.]|uniref:hypothetical protein n=1 Tax=Rubrivirga sp. TaxID=1885344 RepID=UPI003C76C832